MHRRANEVVHVEEEMLLIHAMISLRKDVRSRLQLFCDCAFVMVASSVSPADLDLVFHIDCLARPFATCSVFNYDRPKQNRLVLLNAFREKQVSDVVIEDVMQAKSLLESL